LLMSVPDAVPDATAGCIINIKTMLDRQMASSRGITKAILMKGVILFICAKVTDKFWMQTDNFEEEYEI
jgi:hypothetical protein